MQIEKRDKRVVDFDKERIVNAISKAMSEVNNSIDSNISNEIARQIESELSSQNITPSVEQIQDLVENKLMQFNLYQVAKAYILYREKQSKNREVLNNFASLINNEELLQVIRQVQIDFNQSTYPLENLYNKFLSLNKENASLNERYDMLIKASVELTSKEAPDWEFVASRFLNDQITKQVDKNMLNLNINTLFEKIYYLTLNKQYGDYILANYTQQEIDELESYIDESRNNLLTYSSLHLLAKRYLIKEGKDTLLEKPQEMFMGISMHLAIPEGNNKLTWAKKIYDILSTLKVTMATPTIANGRKPIPQLSSCFIDTVPDTLSGIYRSIDNFAKISKYGGGMGLYFGKVRATGSDIRGNEGVAGGVTRWIKLANATAVAVDQLGIRQGAVAVYLDVWHRDILEFLQLKTNNGDDRLKAHDVFPGICYPDLFWKLVKEDINATWYLMCPHEIKNVMGFSLEDYYGDEWEVRYQQCVSNKNLKKRTISIKDLVRLIIKSATETGTPFAFNRDHVNKMNPNNHTGMIYSTNLCTEICQNMKPIETQSIEITVEDGETVIVNKTKPGDLVVCNLASLVLGNIETDDDNELKDVVTTVIRALDNVITLNYYPIPYADVTNSRYRALGLGTSGYHHLLANKGIKWESDQHLEFADDLYERINYHAINASMEIAREKGSYFHYQGSDWQTGAYFDKRDYTSDKWNKLKQDVATHGIRNGYLLAVAPTGSTSVISGTTASIDPVMNKFFLEEKKGSIVPRVAPNLNTKTYWLYKNAHDIDQEFVVKAAGIRQRHIDQAQSLNLYVTTEFTMRQILNLYLHAWEHGVKTVYYVRSKSLEVEECESCSS